MSLRLPSALWASRRMLRRRLGFFGLLDPASPFPMVLARPAKAPPCRIPLLSEVAEERCHVAAMDWISVSAPPRAEEPKRPVLRPELVPCSQYYFALGRHREQEFMDLSLPHRCQHGRRTADIHPCCSPRCSEKMKDPLTSGKGCIHRSMILIMCRQTVGC